jgi:hypothetical protein
MEDYSTIPLTQGQFAIVDKCLFNELNKHKWYAAKMGVSKKRFYAQRWTREKAVQMHRFILELSGISVQGFEVDHINTNSLDNRLANLRTATKQQNQFNRLQKKTAAIHSQYKGVCWKGDARKWQASATLDGKKNYLGIFTYEADAARAYDEFAKKYHGEYAILNFPMGGEDESTDPDEPGQNGRVPTPKGATNTAPSAVSSDKA